MELKFVFSMTAIYQLFKIMCIRFTTGIFQPLYILMAFSIYPFYKRLKNSERYLLLSNKINLKESVIDSILYGILAGFIGSLLINILGINFNLHTDSFIYLWVSILLLAIFEFKFLSISFIIGSLSLLKLTFDWPNIEVSALLAVVGVIYLLEAFLMFLNGDRGASPTFIKYKNGVVGAFSIKRFWPIPIALLLFDMIPNLDMPSETINLNNPDWWPLIMGPLISTNHVILFTIMTIPIIITYSDVIITESPKKRIKKSAIFLFIYSVILIILSILSSSLSSSIPYIQFVAAIFAIVGHKLLKFYWIRKDRDGQAYFAVPKKGVKVLDVIEGGPAHKIGLLPGDVILKINNKSLMTYGGILTALEDYPNFIWLEVLRDKEIYDFEYKSYPNGINDLDIIIVPRDGNVLKVIKNPYNLSLFIKLISNSKFRKSQS